MMTKRFFSLLWLVAALLMASCTQRQPASADDADSTAIADSVSLVLRVAQTARLHTAEYRVHKIVTHSDIVRFKATVLGRPFEAPLPLGDRKIAIPIDVTLSAYIDFSSFSEQQVERTEENLRIILPDPKVVVTASKVDHAAVRQYADLFRSEYTDEELTEFTSQGVREILKSVPQMGILETARQSAAATLMPLLTSMGYEPEHIVVTFKKPYTERDLPLLFDNERSVVKF